ncbi:MAG: adenylate kinase [Phycisphaerae bacterium]|nr:adenylate kinase [Phycisphaerae bacterium]
MRIVLMGAPGVGKGTQASRLVEAFGLVHLSSGDVFRTEKAGGSELGRKLAEYMDSGRLVPDDIVVEIMAEAITGSDGKAGLLLDGFPRTVAQAEALDAHLAQLGKPLDAMVIITAPDEAIIRRIVGRRSCPKCGKVYNVESMPPRRDQLCDLCDTKLTRRRDDTEELVAQRQAAYKKQTEPVIAYYRSRPDTRVIEIDGDRKLDEVTAAMTTALRLRETEN